ncbi:MAG TPA: 3-hydroxyacyl-CoA dehydrogenase NAD-binding domain-containing protein [Gammaproteobacteria bacterium]|nr:3-hydroxyacyl-CoA dehydrogenase NAD-binding domain-containing protein [Gammaproteobacteria bacterium]
MKLQHWEVEIDHDNIAWWYFDCKDSAVNVVNNDVIDELASLIQLANAEFYRGIVIASAKKTGFAAGADLKSLTKLPPDELAQLVRKVQKVYSDLENLASPTVAIVDGFCMGGGTELILACKYRIAEESLTTRIGLPEIKLGLQPGWGGSVRLPQLIGAPAALQMILTGSPVDAKKAQKLGLVDYAVAKRHLKRAARMLIAENPPKHQPNNFIKLFNSPLIRPLLARYLRHKTNQLAPESHYPAPYAVINTWQKDGNQELAMEREAESILHLMTTETAQNLIRVFFLQDRLKGLSKGVIFKPDRVHVIGAGTMGGDIAAYCALRGSRVTLQDREPKFIAPALKRAYELFKYKLKEPRAIQAAMDRLMPDVEGLGIPHADIIIEAIYENAEAKQKLFQQLEKTAKIDAVLATNTSSIPLKTIGLNMKDPTRIVGIHFFNPVAKMMLVEVVHDEKTNKKVTEKAIAFVRYLDKLPLPVKSAPGFLVNRILVPYMLEAMKLVQEGVAPEIVDKAAVDFGMPMGPIELADTVGLDICLSVSKFLASDKFDLSFLEKLVEEKHLGRKTGQGFYKYKHNKPIKNSHPKSTELPVITRLTHALIYEAKECLREHIVDDGDLVDAGMIFGTGFAPFRGGPIHYAEKEGV